MDIWDLIQIVVSIGLGYFGGYLSFKQKIKSDNISAKRERLVKNISKAEDYIQLMIEESFLEHDLLRLAELIDAIDTNLEVIRKGLGQTEIEINPIEEDFFNIKDKKYHGELEEKQISLLSSIKKYQSLLETQRRKREKNAKELKELDSKIEQINKRLIVDDIGTTFLTIDPSGKISEYLNELQSIKLDKSINFYWNTRAIELRSMIYNYFTECISKVG